MSSPYKIELGVKLNTSEIRTQVSQYNGNSNNAKLKLGVKLDTKGISNQIKDINSKTPVKVDLKLNTKNVQSQINKIKRQIENLGKIKIDLGGTGTGGSKSSNTNNEVNKLKKDYKELLTMSKRINNLEFKIGGFKIAGGHKNEIELLEKQLESLRFEYDKLVTTFNQDGGFNSDIFDVNDFQKLNNAIDESEAKIADLKAKLADDIKINLNNEEFYKQVQSVERDANKLSGSYQKLDEKLDELNLAFNDMNTAKQKNDIDGLILANKRYEKALKEVKIQLDINKKAEQDVASAQKLADDRAVFQSKIDGWLTKNSAAAKKFGSAMLDLKAKAESCDRTTLDHLQKEFKQLDMEADKAGLKMQTFGDRIKSQFAKYRDYLSVATVFMYATQGLKDMFNQVVVIDSAMTELKKVTDETDASYNKFLSSAASRASEIGTTIDGLVASTADFARLGYSFADSQGLAEVANIYAVVGDEVEGVEGATESLISTMAAFKDEASGISNTDFATSIIDKFNEIGNKFAITSGGIGEAMKRSASSLDAANNSIDESIALITAANTVVGLCHAA